MFPQKSKFLENSKKFIINIILIISIICLLFSINSEDFIKLAIYNVYKTLSFVLISNFLFELSIEYFYKRQLKVFDKEIEKNYEKLKIGQRTINAIDEFISTYSEGKIIINSEKIFFLSKEDIYECDTRNLTKIEQGIIAKFIKKNYNIISLIYYGFPKINECCDENSVIIFYFTIN